MEKRETRVQIVIVENGKYIMLKHHYIPKNRYFWGIPGGGIEAGETPEEAAVREAYEETGLTVQLLPYRREEEFLPGKSLYKRKITFIAYPVAGIAKTGFEPEPDGEYELTDMMRQDLFETASLDEYAYGDIMPVIGYIKNNPLVKRAGTLTVNQNGEILLLTGKNKDVYFLPQGHVEEGEDLAFAAVRETAEKAGEQVLLGRKLGFYFGLQGDVFHMTYIFLAAEIKSCLMTDEREKLWINPEGALRLPLYRETRVLLREFVQNLQDSVESK